MESLCRSVCGGTLPKRIWVRRTLIVLGVLSALAGVLAPEVLAQETPCRVIAIDKSMGVVTAKVEASAEGVSAGKAAVGQTFAFHVRDSWRLKTLNVGQGVYANFRTKHVSLDGKQVVGTIGAMGPTPSRAPTPPAKSTPSSSQAGTRPNRGQTPGVTTSHLPANAIRTLAVRVEYILDGEHGIPGARYVRVEYAYHGNPVPKAQDHVRICGEVYRDTDHASPASPPSSPSAARSSPLRPDFPSASTCRRPSSIKPVKTHLREDQVLFAAFPNASICGAAPSWLERESL